MGHQNFCFTSRTLDNLHRDTMSFCVWLLCFLFYCAHSITKFNSKVFVWILCYIRHLANSVFITGFYFFYMKLKYTNEATPAFSYTYFREIITPLSSEKYDQIVIYFLDFFSLIDPFLPEIFSRWST